MQQFKTRTGRFRKKHGTDALLEVAEDAVEAEIITLEQRNWLEKIGKERKECLAKKREETREQQQAARLAKEQEEEERMEKEMQRKENERRKKEEDDKKEEGHQR